MKINEITKPSSLEDADRKLRSSGYKRLGTGSFGAAYQKRVDQVLKLFVSDDTAYLKFVRLAKNTNNPHFPKMIGNPIEVNPTYYAVKIEMLQDIDPSIAYNISSAVKKYIFALQRGKQPTSDTTLYKIIEKYAPDFDQFNEACNLLVELIRSDSDISLDIATRNIMFRNGVLVFADPVTSQTAMTNSNLNLDESDQSEIPEQIDGKPTRNSLGKLIHPTIEGIKNFWRWFGDSKVVDAQGRPLVVYHGTTVRPDTARVKGMGDISSFDRLFTTKFRKHSIDTVGSWFSTNPSEGGAQMYSGMGEGSTMYAVYLSIQSPHETTFQLVERRARLLANGKDDGRMIGEEEVNAYRKWLKTMGKDGITITHDHSNHRGSTEFKDQTAWVALDPTQIKSATGNNGNFSPNSNKITEKQMRINEINSNLLRELKKPREIGQFKKDAEKLTAVDTRENEWRQNLDYYMRGHDFYLIGSGKYGSVYESPFYDKFVIKVFQKDSAYLRWVKFCGENQNNPWVPKIKNKNLVKITPLVYAIRIEKLQPLSPYSAANEFYREYNKWEEDPSYVTDDSHLQKVFDFFNKNDNRKLLDIHNENIMMRGNQIVIIDPFYNWYGLYEPNKYTIDPNE